MSQTSDRDHIRFDSVTPASAVAQEPSAAFIPDRSKGDGISGGEWTKWVTANGHGEELGKGRPTVGGRWVQIVYGLIDVFFVLANGTLAYVLRFLPSSSPKIAVAWLQGFADRQALTHYVGFLLLYASLILLLCQWQDLYRTPRTRSAADESLAIVKAVSLATLLLSAFIYLSGVKIVSRLVVLLSLIFNAITLVAWRYAKRRIVIRRVARGIGTRNVLIIGAGRVGQALAQQLEENKLLGYCFKGFLDENHSTDSRMLGKIHDLPRIARAEFVDDVFITIPSERELVKRIAVEAQRYRLNVQVVPELYDGLGWHAPIRHVGDFPVMELQWRALPASGLLLKRGLDVVLSFIGLVLCVPIFALLALGIKADSEGPVFYRSRRVGKKGQVFTCYKLRTMVTNAEQLKASLRHRNERQGPFFKINDDPRITRIGKLLRKYSLDELPQLWNVFRGEMSLVGPRPHPLDDYERYDLDHLCRLDVKPGITGLWQVAARHDPSFETNMECDVQYIEHWNLGLDFKILLRTAAVVAKGTGK